MFEITAEGILCFSLVIEFLRNIINFIFRFISPFHSKSTGSMLNFHIVLFPFYFHKLAYWKKVV